MCDCKPKHRDEHDPQIRKCKHEKTVITIEGIWSDGTVRTKPFHLSSTGVAMMHLRRGDDGRDLGKPWLTRVYYDGALVREFDSKKEKYTLAIDGGCCVIPDGSCVVKTVL